MNPDPLTVIPDEPVEVVARPRQRWALILAVAGVAAIVLLLVGGTRL